MAGLLERLGIGRKKWEQDNLAPADEITPSLALGYGAGVATISTLMGSGVREARQRAVIYNKWAAMEATPVVAAALKILCTATLGGHETTGDIVFIEPKGKMDKGMEALVDEISRRLSPIFNRIAFEMAYSACTFGDAYARVYCDDGGVVDLYTDEVLRAPMVQAYERGGRTVGVSVNLGKDNFTSLDVSQIARLKMPRHQWVPQMGAVQKALKADLANDDWRVLPVLPAMVGGSLLYNVESSYDDLMASLLGMVGQRWQDSIDEQIIRVNLANMTAEHQDKFMSSVRQMFVRSKEIAEKAVVENRPVLERVRHIMPVFDEKQSVEVMPGNGGQSGRAGQISIDDVMVHARLLAGGLGVDLSMLGFADQMSGGLGEGGFFRTSAQAAEVARHIRSALTEFFNHVIDIHTLKTRGVVISPENRPWELKFHSSIAALEAEKKQQKLDAMNAAQMFAQTLHQLRELGADEEYAAEFMAKVMDVDMDEAKSLARIMKMGGGQADEGF